MNKEVRRALWNFYAWPITLLYAMTAMIALAKIELASLSNAVICIPALTALHLHIRDRKFLPAIIWKFFAFFFLVWDLFYSFWLEPLQSGEKLSLASPSSLLIYIPLIISLPLYMALFRYAFRDWSSSPLPGTAQEQTARQKPILINSIQLFTTAVCALFIVFVLFPSIREAWYFKKNFSRTNAPLAYIIPVERIITDKGIRLRDHVKVDYINFEMSLPFKDFESRCDSPLTNKTTIIKMGEGKIIDISLPEVVKKDKKGGSASFDTYSRILYMTPDQINPFMPAEKDKKNFLLIVMKATAWSVSGSSGSIYKFKTPDLRGFQFNISDTNAKNVLIFDKNDIPYDIRFAGFSQEEIDYVLSSIRLNDRAGRSATDHPRGIRIGECIFMNRDAANKYLEKLWKQQNNPLIKGQSL